jgi:hypothetical protein
MREKKKAKSKLPKGKMIPDNKPMNDYKKVAKEGIKARNAGRKGT